MSLEESILFQILIISGLAFLIDGFIMLKFPPKKINGLYGYRTSSSMKSKKRWEFAQTYAAKRMMIYALMLILSSFLGLLIEINESIDMFIGIGILILVCVLLMIDVEKEIKNRFKDNADDF